MSHHLSRMEKRDLVCRADVEGTRYPDVVLTAAGCEAIRASAAANAARVRQLFIDVVGPERLAVLKEASDDVMAAIDDHVSSDCPPEIRGS